FGAWGEIDSDGNAAQLDHDTYGFFLGADAAVFDAWRLGFVAGYSRSTFDIEDRSSSGESDNFHIGVYGGRRWGRLGLRLGAAQTWHEIDIERTPAFAGFSDSLNAEIDARTTQVYGELGYRFETGDVTLEPFANVAYVYLDTDGFSEGP